MQAACGSSEWTNAVEFTTAKEITYPYREAFDRMPAEAYTEKAGAMPDGWVVDSRWNNIRATNYDNYSASYLPYVTTKQNHANSAYVNASLLMKGTSISSPTSTSGGYTSIAMLPAMPKDVKNMQISFWAYSTNGACDIKVGVANTQTADLAKGKQLGENITEVATLSVSKSKVWVKYAANLSAYAGSGRYITLYLLPGTGTPEVFIDDIVVEDIACGEVIGMEAEAVNTTSIRAWWDDLAATSWNVKVSSTEIDPTSQNGDIANETVTEKAYTATGLQPATTYFFYVSPACANKWEMVETATLKVTGTAIPYYNDFTNETSGYGTTAAPVRGPKDWKLGYTYADTYTYSSTSVPYVNTTAWANPPYGIEKNSLYLNNTTNANTQFPYAIMPEVTNADVKDLTISFYAYTTGTSNIGTTADKFYGQFKIGVVESINDINKANKFTKVTNVATIKITESKVAQLFVIDMSGYAGTGKHIVFYQDLSKANTNYLDNLSITLTSANAPQPVTDVVTSGITQSGVTLAWTENGNATQWDVRLFKKAQDDPEDGTPIWADIVNATTVTLADTLDNSTKYVAYVRSVQPNGNGAWGGPVSFYTECGPIAVPFYEDWNSYETGSKTSNTFSPCYSVAHSSASQWPYVGSYTKVGEYHPSRTNLLWLELTTAGKVSQLEFPHMAEPVNKLQMELEASGSSTYYGDNSITYFGVVSSDGVFHKIAERKLSAAKTWENWLIDFSSYDIDTYGDGVIAIRMDYDATGLKKSLYIGIENVKISTIPECKNLQPEDVEFTEIGPDSATISWSLADASKWNLKVSTTPLENPAAVTADIFDGEMTTNSKKFTGLDDNTRYYVYVQTVRPEKECVGAWSRAAKFKTTCFPRQFPYEENFDSYETTGAGNLPDCSNICGEDAEHSYISTKNNSKCLYVNQKAKTHKNYFVFPALNSEDVRKLQLSMQVYVGTTATTKYHYQVGIMTNAYDPSTFVALHTEELLGSANAYDRVYKFDSYEGDEHGNFGGYVAISPQDYVTSSSSTGYTSLYIDNVVIDIISTCEAPNDLKTDSIGIKGAKLIWNTDDKTAAHRVRIFDKADAKPNSNTFVAEAVVNDSVALIESLNGNTIYYAYVRKECAADDNSKWTSACKFITECEEVQSLPYKEGFEGRPYANITDKAMPACWTNQTIQGCGDYPSYYSSTAKKDGEYGLYLQTTEVDEHAGGSCVGRQRSAVVTPALDVNNLSELLVYFDTKAVSSSVKGAIKIEAVSDETTNAEVIYITTIDNISNTEWQKGYVRIKDYYSSVKPYNRLRFTPTANTSVYIDNMVFTKDINVIFPVDNLKLQMLTESSVKFSFVETTPIIKQWQVAYVAAGGDIADATILNIDATEYTITGLAANTSYDIYVRGNLEGDEWVGPLSATTLQTPAALPYSTGFEDDANLWNLYNVKTVQGAFYPNFFIVGDASQCDGTGEKALFLTNDSLTWNSWGKTIPDGDIATSYVWATRNISIPSAGTYKFRFKVKAPVAYSSHGAWAQLFPAGATIKGETATLLNGTTRSGKATSSAPANNCYTVMSQVFSTSTWEWRTASVDVEEAGVYTLGFYWYNTAAGAKKEQPIAIDSVLVEEYLCTTPKNIEFVALSGESVSLKWFAGKCQNFEYVVSQYKSLGNPAGIDAEDKVAAGTITDGPQVTINNLLPATDYSFYVRTICPDGETDWVEFDFSTRCIAETMPYTEGFYEEPECWILSGATIGTTTVGTSASNEKWNRLLLANGGYAVLPELAVDIKNVEIEIGLFNTTSNYGAVSLGAIDLTYDPDSYDEIAFFQTTTKPESTGSYTPTQLEVFTKMLNLYQGSGKVLAIKNATANPIGVKYVKLTELPDCVKPQQVELTYPTENAVTVNWLAGLEEAWEIQINDSVIENVTTNPYRITGLEQGTVYNVSVRAICDSEHKSDWSLPAKFQTLCGINPLPMFEDFSSLAQPQGTTDIRRATLTCWDNFVSDGNIDQVFKGEIAPYQPASNLYVGDVWVSNWLSRLGDYAQLHSYRRDQPKNRYKWFISPRFAIEGNATLSFDIRACNNVGNAVENPDRTFVAISTDNGATWKKDDATLITDIDSVYTTKSISLGKYAGQNIRIAFYDENVLSSHKMGAQPFVLIDNVRMNCVDTYKYTDNACQGYDYEGFGFSIKKDDLPIAGQDSTYRRFATSIEAGCDSTVELTITTRTASEPVTLNETICKGDTFEFGGQKLTEPNPAGTPYYLVDQNQYGCDSLIYLNLTVAPKDTIDVTPITVKVDQLPYTVDEFYTIPAGTPIGQFEKVVETENCHSNRYNVTIEDVGSGIINITNEMDHIDVYDALGRKIRSIRQNDEQNPLPQGLYIIQTVMKDGSVANGKVTVK